MCFDVCEWDRKIRLTSRCLLFLCKMRSHSVLYVDYQLSVLRVSRPRTGLVPVTHMSLFKSARPRREQRLSMATWTQSGRKSSACKLNIFIYVAMQGKQLQHYNNLGLRKRDADWRLQRGSDGVISFICFIELNRTGCNEAKTLLIGTYRLYLMYKK